MATYAVGDIHGCMAAFSRLLQKIAYSPAHDDLWLVGDVVNRGPDSLAVLRWLRRQHAARPTSISLTLGNHDLHLLAVQSGAAAQQPGDTLAPILNAPDADELCDWLRRQPLAHTQHGYLMVHAGVLPQWSAAQTLSLATEAQQIIGGAGWQDFARQMYGDHPAQWHDGLTGAARLRVIINALTRLRVCTADGEMTLRFSGPPANAPASTAPWFAAPRRQTANTPIIFGHWSTLGEVQQKNIFALDKGCLWGGQLAALRLEDQQWFTVQGKI